MKKLILITIAILFSAISGFGAEFTVSPDMDSDCADLTCTLESALAAAATNGEGDTIRLSAGTYETAATFLYAPADENFPLTIEGAGVDDSRLTGDLDAPILRIDTTWMADDADAAISVMNVGFTNTHTTGCKGLEIETNAANITIGNIGSSDGSCLEIVTYGADIWGINDIAASSVTLVASQGNIILESGANISLNDGNAGFGTINLNGNQSGVDISVNGSGSVFVPPTESGSVISGEVSGSLILTGPCGDCANPCSGGVLIPVGEVSPIEVDFGAGGTIISGPLAPICLVLPFAQDAVIQVSSGILSYLGVPEGNTIKLDPTLLLVEIGAEEATVTWIQTGGPPVVLTDAASASPSFITPSVNGNEDCLLSFECTLHAGEEERSGTVYIDILDNGITGFAFDVLTFKSTGEREMGIGLESAGHLVGLRAIDPADLPGRPETAGDMPYGLLDFSVRVDQPGDTARVTVYLPEPAPEGYGWFKHHPETGWTDFSDHAAFNADRTAVTLTLVDGGIGDDDGVADGVIHDPSGLAEVVQTDVPGDTEAETGSKTSSGGGGSDSGCFISALF